MASAMAAYLRPCGNLFFFNTTAALVSVRKKIDRSPLHNYRVFIRTVVAEGRSAEQSRRPSCRVCRAKLLWRDVSAQRWGVIEGWGEGMSRETRLVVLLNQLYDAAFDPPAWRHFLESLAHAYDGSARIFAQHSTCRAGQASGPADELSSFPRVALAPLLAHAVWDSAAPCQGQDMGTARTESQSPFHRMESVIFAQEGVRLSLALARTPDMRPFSRREIREWKALIPHLRRMVELRLRWADSQLGPQYALFVLDALGLGIAVVSRQSTLLFASLAAKQIIDRADGLSVIQGRLHAAPVVRDRFASLVSRIATERNPDADSREIVALPRAHGERPMSALVMSFPQRRFMLRVPSAIVLLNDPTREVTLRERDLASVYGLTAAEGKLLCELARGVPLADYAASAGIAHNTAKSYLQQIFAKTGQSRQVDLLREIVSDPLLRVASEVAGLCESFAV
jgi:DNA-binding CsgD family transcriptional regulator